MATNDTGIVMDVEDEVTQESGEDATTEAAVAEMIGGAQVADHGPSDPVASGAVTSSPAPSENAGVEADAASGADVATLVGAPKEPNNEAPTYTQEYVDQLKVSHNREIQTIKDKGMDIFRRYRRRYRRLKDAIKSIYEQLDDATTHVKRHVFVEKMAHLKKQADEAKDVKRDLINVRKQLECKKSQCNTAENESRDLTEKYQSLDNSNRELVAQYQKLQGDYQSELSAKNACQQQLKNWETAWSRMIAAFAPLCLKERDWFLELLSELQEEVYKDPPSDAAILLFASLAELAVMERTSAGPCFEWKKQLADIGLVVANYMHQKKSAEGDVLKMLRNFSQALQEMPILKKLKIAFKVPSLGSDFNTDEVKHKNNGSSIAKVINWCIVEDGHVYCKAIVE